MTFWSRLRSRHEGSDFVWLSLWSNGNLVKQEQRYWVFFHVLPFIGLLFGLWINHPLTGCISVTSKRKYHWGRAILWVQDAYKDAHSAVIQGFAWLAFKEGFCLLSLIVMELYCNQLHGISKLMMQEMSSLDNKIDSKQDQWWEVPSVWKKCICRCEIGGGFSMTSWVSALHYQRASPDRLYKNFLWAGEQALNAGAIEKIFATQLLLGYCSTLYP